MIRRHFLLSLSGLAAFATMAIGQTDTLADAFAALDPAARRAAQEQLTAAGFYQGAIDGSFGPRTRSALINAAAFVKDNSYGRADYDLASPSQAGQFLTELSSGALAKYLWGEGDEADGG